MNRQELLLAAKAECLRQFRLLLPELPKRCADSLFAMAERVKDYKEQRILLDAYGAITKRKSDLQQQLETNLGNLIDRGLRTAYHIERPALPGTISADTLTLVDSSIIEDELKLGKLTSRFHAKGGAAVRELNARIAMLFEQTKVSERENPFRPYLFSRCISTSLSDIGLSPEGVQAASQELVNQLADGVADIYKALNAFFEKNGIITKLTGTSNPIKNQLSNIARDIFNPSSRASEPGANEKYTDRNLHASGTSTSGTGTRKSPLHKVEQLLRMVRKNAGPAKDERQEAATPGRNLPHAVDSNAHFTPPLTGGTATSSAAPAPTLISYGDGLPSLPSLDAPTESGATVAPQGAGSAAASTSGASSDSVKYSVLRDDVSLSTDKFSGAAASSGTPASDSWASGKQIVGDALKQFLKGGMQEPDSRLNEPHEPRPVSLAGALAALPANSVYHVLKEANVNTLGDVLDENGEVRNLILENRHALASMASDAGEMMTIDVVGMIFEFMLRDPQVPTGVRAQLGRLQLLLLKMALLDPQLLMQRDHPARMLINRVGTISHGVKENEPFSERLTAEIDRIVEVLLSGATEGSDEVMPRLLDEFEAFATHELRTTDHKVERAVAVIEKAEQRSAHVRQLRAQLRKVLSVVKTDPYLQRLIEDWWLLAIEKAEQTDPELARRYRQLVPELVWSILEKRTERDRSQLLAVLPNMLADLKNGLNSVKCTEKQEFLGWLIDNHTRAIKAVGIRSDLLSLAWVQQQFELFTNPSASSEIAMTEDENEDPGLQRRMISDAVDDLKARLDITDPIVEFGSDIVENDRASADKQSASSIPYEALDTENIINRLSVGEPIEVNLDGTPRNALLNWMSVRARHMILSFEANSVPTMVTVRLFRRLLLNGRARFLEAAPLFERAVNALLETADQVDEIFE